MPRFLLPVLISAALCASVLASNPLSDWRLFWLHVSHLLSVAAALAAFWQPTARRRSRHLEDFVCGALWAILLGWTLLNQRLAGASHSIYPFFITAMDAGLLFYAARQSALHDSRATLLIIALGNVLLLSLAFAGFHPLDTLSSCMLLAFFTAASFLALFFGNLPITLQDSHASWFRLPPPPISARGAAWWFSLIFLVCFLLLGSVVRVTLQKRQVDLQTQVVDFPRQSLAPALVRENLRASPVEGLGLGVFESLLRGYGVFFVPVSHTPTPERLFPHAEAKYLRGLISAPSAARAVSPLPHLNLRAYRWLPEPSTLHSFQVLILESGLLGTGFALLAFLFLAMNTLYVLAHSPRSAQSIFAAAVFAMWLALIGEGFLGLALRRPSGLLLLVSMAGFLWGVVCSLRPETTVLEVAPEDFAAPENPARDTAFWTRAIGSGAATLVLLLFMTLPLRNAYLLKKVREDKTDAAALGYANAALRQDPFNDETYAVLARFYEERGEPERMRDILEKARPYCAASPLLTAWRVEYARLASPAAERILALESAARAVSALRPELQPFYLEECANELEKLKDSAGALEMRRRQFLLTPSDAGARAAYERLAASLETIHDTGGNSN